MKMMNGLSIACVLLMVALIHAHESSPHVVDLTPDNFDSVLDGSKHVFVMFYAPWCGHCKKLAPDWVILGESFAHSKERVVIARVDADEHKALGNKFDVHGYPTLKWFPKGSTKPEDYDGPRDLTDLATFVSAKSGEKSKIKTPVTAVVDLNPSNFDRIVLDTSKDVLVEFYAPWCGHCKHLAPEYEVVANAFVNEPSIVVAKIDADKHSEIGSKYGVGAFPTLIWFPKGDKTGKDLYNGPREVDAIIEHINNHAGTRRDSKGLLSADAGRIAELDAVAEKWDDTEDKASLIKELEGVVAALKEEQQTDAKYYLKVATTAKDSNDFITNESARLDRLLSSGSLNVKKVDEITKKRNILGAF